ncbi:MAG: peptidoglycan-binding domain-containing protein [Candidatus Azambacteria bacterium]|nr:peptidoglycan-binding domain-containing protein [Candidatus Azambacteria bacterium]
MVKNLKIIFLAGIIFLAIPLFARGAETEFNVDSSYDYLGRSKINSFLHQLGINAYFYVENDFYQTLDLEKRKEFTDTLQGLSKEFDEVIYPRLRATFGQEWKPGIDGDEKITVLITQIKGDAGGYFNSGDEYPKIQSPNSNEREMIYLNSAYINSALAKSFLAHEFLHLITFNQKEKTYGVSEEVWLNEARAEFAPTFLGYDQVYEGSSLQKRIRTFLQKPNDSLTEWKGETADYGVLDAFVQYLTDYYSVKILSDSLLSDSIGILSLNAALKKNGYSEDFSQIFTNWTIAVLANDCRLGQKLCYLNQNLKAFKISPQLNFLPSMGESTLSLTDYAKNWAGNWYKFIGGKGTLRLEFIGEQGVKFKVPFLLEDSLGNYSLDFFKLDDSQRGTNYFADFGRKYISLTIIPSIQSKVSGFDGLEKYYKFLWTASIINESQTKAEDELMKNLLLQIASLQEQIARLQFQIAEKLAKERSPSTACSGSKFENNLYYGMKDSAEVRCLQELLKSQITGNYFSLTMAAVKKYQASRGIIQTGYFGPLTRAAINQEIR